MVTYEQLYHLDLKKLNAAVEAWDTQIRQLQSLDDAFTSDVSKTFQQAGWRSGDFTSVMAAEKVKEADRELTEAVAEAKGIRGILRDAHDRLKKHKADLVELADVEAPSRGLVVSSTGRVHVRNDPAKDLTGLDDAEKKAVLAAQKEKVDDVTGKIEDILLRAGATDELCAEALRRNVDGKAESGFNSTVYTTVNSYKKSMKETPERVSTQGAPFGSSTIKPVAEFLSYKSWINGLGAAVHGKGSEAWNYFLGGTGSAAVSAMSTDAGKSLTGWNRAGSVLNKAGSGILKFGSKVFGFPVCLAATGIDYAYTPEADSAKLEKHTRTVAPGKVNAKY
ncbi:hypothetical protein [Streptomyces halobius]|uniref:WXG100 family type VII secretion target n=1 Tax=Streptomyces halobius TaxID=2879846 RepID=A0ABY4MFU7_9ACTN|nr:hypothetical protein [Streptomyces halobius]UQA95594.1 hypothetical protein K9S39_30390 [Streptomyces halobius]